MIDPLTALGLASNIVQFVDLGSKLLIEGYGVYKSQQGAPEDALEAEKAIEKLQELASRLMVPRSAAPSHDEIELFNLAGECVAIAGQLLNVLENLKVTAIGSARTWDSWRKTIQRHWKADEIERIQKRLDRVQKHIGTQLLAVMRNEQSNIVVLLRQAENTSKRMHFAEMGRIDARTNELQMALVKQNEAVNALFGEVQRSRDEHASFMLRYETSLNILNDRLLAVQQEASMILTSQRILDSLLFDDMGHRYARIEKEHPMTFSWIFNQSQTPFKAWLEKMNGIFWISGKAGSGKSTLMKYLADNPNTVAALRVWAASNGKQLVTASFFFWHAGSEMQKSQQGLFQSLLHQTFLQCPEIIRLATPPQRWEGDDSRNRTPKPWELSELLQALQIVSSSGDSLSKVFCFFVDGLDEYSGDHFILNEVLNNLARSTRIKLCVSSRPWTVFKEAYGRDLGRNIVLQDFTKPDMDKYIRGMLEDDSRFKNLARKDSRAWRLVSEIRNRAEGVFLWVFLVVRRLLALMTENVELRNSLETLERALDDLPSDLDLYFRHIVETIQEAHRAHTAAIFRLAIDAAPLPLIAFYYLPQVLREPDSVIEALIEPDDEDKDDEMIRKITNAVNAWCKDLLEVRKVASPLHPSENELDYRIDFLHRTVRDFLFTNEDVQRIFSGHLPTDFNSSITMMRLLLAQMKTLDIKVGKVARFMTFINIACEFMKFAKLHETQTKKAHPKLLGELDRVGEHFRSIYNGNRSAVANPILKHWTNACDMYIPYYLKRSSLGDLDFLAFTAMFDLQRYVMSRLMDKKLKISAPEMGVILNHVLHPLAHHRTVFSDKLPSYDMVLLLLEGALNARSSLNETTIDETPWNLFLHRCYSDSQPGLWPVARLLVSFGADRHAEIQEGARKLRRVPHTTYYHTEPNMVSAYECVSRCCTKDQLSELAKLLNVVVLKPPLAPSEETKTSSWKRFFNFVSEMRS